MVFYAVMIREYGRGEWIVCHSDYEHLSQRITNHNIPFYEYTNRNMTDKINMKDKITFRS